MSVLCIGLEVVVVLGEEGPGGIYRERLGKLRACEVDRETIWTCKKKNDFVYVNSLISTRFY